MEGVQQYLWPYLLSQTISLLLLFLAWRKPNVARGLFSLLFLWAAGTNLYTAQTTPSVYLDYSPLAWDVYSRIIDGFFSAHIVLFVSLIALGQLAIGIGMLLWDTWVRLACVGAILFLLAIAPLGVGSAFPFSLTVSCAAYLLLRQQTIKPLWRSNTASG